MIEPTTTALVAAFSQASVLVLGDVMLDEYVWGEVRRISQEAPVPVVECLRRTYAPGGAANVAANVAELGGRATLGGVVGHDASAQTLRNLLQEARVIVEGLVEDAERPTTTKTRIVAHSQQMLRVDSESRRELARDREDELLAWAARLLPTVGACVLSDYNKGAISPRLAETFIGMARAQGKPVVVDPKGVNYAKYRGATLITPNIPETERVVARELHTDAEVEQAAHDLATLLDGTAILITRGAGGMTLFQRDRPAAHIPTAAREVYDVTGAGDTVVSTLALALASGAELEPAARLANHAAGIVVGKLGTARVTRDELLSHE